jgi:hypothetical protein
VGSMSCGCALTLNGTVLPVHCPWGIREKCDPIVQVNVYEPDVTRSLFKENKQKI